MVTVPAPMVPMVLAPVPVVTVMRTTHLRQLATHKIFP